MSADAVFREYNPNTGSLLGSVSSIDFGRISVGEFSQVRVFDVYFPGDFQIFDVKLSIVGSTRIYVNESPEDINTDGSAGNGNFGIETSSEFIPKNTLTRFFAGENLPVSIGTRDGRTSKYIYLNVIDPVDNLFPGSVVYQISFSTFSSSSSSSYSSSSCSYSSASSSSCSHSFSSSSCSSITSSSCSSSSNSTYLIDENSEVLFDENYLPLILD